ADERLLQCRQGGDRTSRWRGGNLLAPGPFVFAIVVGVIAIAILIVVVGMIAVAIMVVGVAHRLPPFWKAMSASENRRADSTRPGSGTCAFSTRTSETPERFETMSSGGTLRPRAFARSSTCLGERMT